MTVHETLKSGFPDFSTFGMAPKESGAFVEVSADGDSGTIKGSLFIFPNGLVGALEIWGGDGVFDHHEQAQIDLLTVRCAEGTWTLERLSRAMQQGTYAWALVMDAIAAGAA